MRPTSIFSLILLITMAGLSPGARAQTVLKVVHIDDPGVAAVFYAAKEGIVRSDKIKLEVSSVPLPALIQAMQTKQFDIIQTSVIAYAKGVKRGLKARIIAVGAVPRNDGYGIFVRRDSPIKGVADLRGKNWGVLSLGASNVVHTRIVLNQKYNINTAPLGGDLRPIEAPPLQLLTLLEKGNIDAMFAFGIGFYSAARHKDFRLLINSGAEYGQAFGPNPPMAALVAFTDRIEQNPEAMREAQRLLYDSAKYYIDHREEVNRAVASKYRVSLDYLNWWASKGQIDPPFLRAPIFKGTGPILTTDLQDRRVRLLPKTG